MSQEKYTKELKRLENSELSQEDKVKLIEKLYILINMNYRNFFKNNWQIIIK